MTPSMRPSALRALPGGFIGIKVMTAPSMAKGRRLATPLLSTHSEHPGEDQRDRIPPKGITKRSPPRRTLR